MDREQEIKKINEEITAEQEREWSEFEQSYDRGECYLCGKSFNSFEVNDPCLHWLIRPDGLSKTLFRKTLLKYPWFKIDAFIRWMANKEAPFRQINDLPSENSYNTPVLLYTVKFKNIEWTVKCTTKDRQGHKGKKGKVASEPHYHLQVMINNQLFWTFGDHIPFHQEDFMALAAYKDEIPGVGFSHGRGIGMKEFNQRFIPDELLNVLIPAEREENATHRIQTLILAKPGKTLSGDQLAEVLRKSKEQNKPVAKLLGELDNVGTIQTFISEGPGVVEQKDREKKGKRN